MPASSDRKLTISFPKDLDDLTDFGRRCRSEAASGREGLLGDGEVARLLCLEDGGGGQGE